VTASFRSVGIRVTDHARDRARERFPGFKAARIVDEVREALREGRVSADRPEGVRSKRHDGLYVWTPDGVRVYALKATLTSLIVLTTVKGEMDERRAG
jgi:hypothetical protein